MMKGYEIPLDYISSRSYYQPDDIINKLVSNYDEPRLSTSLTLPRKQHAN